MIEVRRYGLTGAHVVLLHGGPGAPGHMAPIARRLAMRFRVLEPFQRPSGVEPLTVRTHVADLYNVVRSLDPAPLLAGSSWGAMLALAFAAEHPDRTGGLVLIGCGTFDAAARRTFQETVSERLDAATRDRLERLDTEIPDPDGRLREKARLLLPAYSCDLVTDEEEVEHVDSRANRETWQDMVRLQEEGVYPQAFRRIGAPVLMLHGARDPHPGAAIRDSLLPFIPHLEYREWARCGHYPWLEREVREAFFDHLAAWLEDRGPAMGEA